MRIHNARVIVTCPGRNFVTLKIETDQGLYGIGDATLNGREKAVVSYLEDHVIPCLIGMDPQRIEDIWQYLYRGAYWRRGPVTMRAIAAIDVALWDIVGQHTGQPSHDESGHPDGRQERWEKYDQGTRVPQHMGQVEARRCRARALAGPEEGIDFGELGVVDQSGIADCFEVGICEHLVSPCETMHEQRS